MSRKRYEKKPFFRPMNWWDRLFWKECFSCEDLFKGEEGWKAGGFVHEGGGTSYVYSCKKCFDDPEKAEKEYKECYRNHQTLMRVLRS